MRPRRVLGVVFACIFVVSATALLFSMGSRGGEIADVMSAGISALSLIATVVNLYAMNGNGSDTRPGKPHRNRRAWIAAAVLLATAGLGVAGYSVFVIKPDIPVTDQVTITNGERMKIGVEAEIRIPGTPPERAQFAFVPTLVNPDPVGDCVGSARLKITLTIDGKRAHQETGLLPAREVKLDLHGTTREAKVSVLVDMQDPNCEVNLSLAEAALFN